MAVSQEMIYGLRPIFKPEIDFLKQQLDIDIPENCCWMNKMNIYGFDKETGKRIRLYRIKCKQMKLELIKNEYDRIVLLFCK